jgi:hypothetical protein
LKVPIGASIGRGLDKNIIIKPLEGKDPKVAAFSALYFGYGDYLVCVNENGPYVVLKPFKT